MNAVRCSWFRTCLRAGFFFPLVVATVWFAGGVSAQQKQPPGVPTPVLLTVYPSGAKAGSAVEITLTGQDLDEPQGLLFSDPGIKADVIEAAQPLAKSGDTKRSDGTRRGMAATGNSAVKFKATLPPATPLGLHDLRIVSKWGVSNPRAFVVGDQVEVLEQEPNNDTMEAQKIALGSTVNGAIATPTDVDYFSFSGKKGQRVVASCLASSIDSRLPAALQLYTSEGSLLALNREYQGTDAVLDATLPADGQFLVRVHGFTYTQGGPDNFYRLTVSTAPWIDSIFPPVVELGKKGQLTVYGRNLPGGKLDPSVLGPDGTVLEKATVSVDVPRDGLAQHRLAFRGHVPPRSTMLDGFEYRLRGPAGSSNGVLVQLAQAPVVLDAGDNDTPEKAQKVTAPCEIAGWVEKKRDRDWYSFTAKKGDVYSIDVFGDRLGTPATFYFTLRGPDGRAVESAESQESLNPVQFYTRTDDPVRQRFAVPADGTYLLQVRSREADLQAGVRYVYRVRIGPEQPDFRLVVMPPSVNSPDACIVPRGGRQFYTVYVWRLDGFGGDVTLSADGLPPGVRCSTQTIGGGTRQATLVLDADEGAALWAGQVRIKGTARVNGREIVREARAATVTWPIPDQQNIPTISRLDRELVLAVREASPFTLTATVNEVSAAAGDKVTIPLKVKRTAGDFKAPIQVTLVNAPPNIALTSGNQGTALAKDEGNVVLDVRQNVAPGTYTIVLRGQAQGSVSRDAAGKQKQNATLSQPSSPITLTILPKQLATLSVSPNNPTVKRGGKTEVVVRVSRLFDYDGEFKVKLVLPDNVKGLRAADAVIPAGKDETKLVLEADAEAPRTDTSGLRIQAVALFQGKLAVNHESRLSVNVSR